MPAERAACRPRPSEHLESYLAARHEPHERPVPGFVADALRDYPRCGIRRRGFARFRCDDCADSRLVALSCKQRAFCPRCVRRKMAEQAKPRVEQVLPPVPYRHWVLSFRHAFRCTLHAVDFLARLLRHTLPRGFHAHGSSS